MTVAQLHPARLQAGERTELLCVHRGAAVMEANARMSGRRRRHAGEGRARMGQTMLSLALMELRAP